MKLYNHTPIEDKILERLLVKAGQSIGARTSDVIVQVNRGRIPNCSRAVACRCDIVKLEKRWTNTDGGYFKISLSLPLKIFSQDSLQAAETFLEVARHEWGHIRDYQESSKPFSARSLGRRPPHNSRPEEIRAANYIYDSDKKISKNYFEDVLLNLGIEIERIRIKEKSNG